MNIKQIIILCVFFLESNVAILSGAQKQQPDIQNNGEFIGATIGDLPVTFVPETSADNVPHYDAYLPSSTHSNVNSSTPMPWGPANNMPTTTADDFLENRSNEGVFEAGPFPLHPELSSVFSSSVFVTNTGSNLPPLVPGGNGLRDTEGTQKTTENIVAQNQAEHNERYAKNNACAESFHQDFVNIARGGSYMHQYNTHPSASMQDQMRVRVVNGHADVHQVEDNLVVFHHNRSPHELCYWINWCMQNDNDFALHLNNLMNDVDDGFANHLCRMINSREETGKNLKRALSNIKNNDGKSLRDEIAEKAFDIENARFHAARSMSMPIEGQQHINKWLDAYAQSGKNQQQFLGRVPNLN